MYCLLSSLSEHLFRRRREKEYESSQYWLILQMAAVVMGVLDWTKAGRQELHGVLCCVGIRNPRSWVILCSLPRYVSRKLRLDLVF